MASKDDLDKIRAHFQKSGGSSSSDKNWFKIPPESGAKITVRILPPWNKAAAPFPFYTGGLHFGVRIGGRERALACPEAADPQRGVCPACTLVSALNESGKFSKLANRLKLQRKFWVNLIDRSDEDAGVKMFGGNKKFIEAVLDASDEGKVWSSKSGRDMTIRRKGTGFNSRYSYSFKTTPTAIDLGSLTLYDLDKDVQEWMPYSQMVEVLKANFNEEIAKLGVRFKKDKSEVVEDKPKKKIKPVVDEEDDEELEDVEDIDEDDEEEIEEDEDEE